jgi:hypothetical protein
LNKDQTSRKKTQNPLQPIDLTDTPSFIGHSAAKNQK